MIKALNDYVLMSEIKKKDNKGIIIPGVSKGKPAVMMVESVGEGIVPKIKTGDMVIIDPFILREIVVDDGKLYVAQGRDIFAIITSKK